MNEIPSWLFEVPVGTLIPCDKAPLFPVRHPEVMVGKRVVVLEWVELVLANDDPEEFWRVAEQKVRP